MTVADKIATNNTNISRNCNSNKAQREYKQQYKKKKQQVWKFRPGTYAGFEPGRTIAPIPHYNWNCPLTKWPRGQFVPFKIKGKKLKRKHTWRDLFQYRNCKLKQNLENIFYRTFKVHSKVTFQSCALLNTYVSCSTKRGERAWQSLTCHIENVFEQNIRKLFRSKSKPEWIREKWYRRRSVC